jgi:hypothetical protein
MFLPAYSLPQKGRLADCCCSWFEAGLREKVVLATGRRNGFNLLEDRKNLPQGLKFKWGTRSQEASGDAEKLVSGKAYLSG